MLVVGAQRVVDSQVLDPVPIDLELVENFELLCLLSLSLLVSFGLIFCLRLSLVLLFVFLLCLLISVDVSAELRLVVGWFDTAGLSICVCELRFRHDNFLVDLLNLRL